MAIRRAKPADAVYDEVAAYDLVIVPDAPFASAVNRRLDRPHFGTFATTPRRFAAQRREHAEDRTAFLEIIDRTDHDWRAVAHTIGNVLQCWEHRGAVDSILEYDAYADSVTRDVVAALADIPTTSRFLAERTVDGDCSTAIVGRAELTPLERAILTPAVDSIDPFTAEPFDLPDVHIFDSKTGIITALLDSIDAENADHVAVVLDASSEYSSLVESALEAAGVPFYGGPGFIDDPDRRAFIELLRVSFRGAETTVGDVRPVLTRLGFDVPIAHREKRVGAVDAPGPEWIVAFATDIETLTFDEALAAFVDRTGRDLPALAAELDKLGLTDEPVTDAGVSRLAYYLETYEVPIERANEGVLLVDAHSSAYVDRPAVFFLGLDEGWTRSAPQRPWVDPEAMYDRDIAQFQRLLQSGDSQYYLVLDAAGGEPVTPCLYFEDLLPGSIERFGDLPSTRHRPRPRGEATGFDREAVAGSTRPVETISQSSLNTYVNSPRDYLFDRLLEGPDRDYFLEGTLFHDFAEFYVAHPDVVADIDPESLAGLMLEEVRPFVADADVGLRRRKYRIGLETITEYLADARPTDDAFLTPDSGWGRNFFADHFDRPIDSPLTERWFENAAIGAKGMIDLVRAPDELVDHKSGAKKSASQVVRRSATDPPAETPNYQAILYLCHWRTVQPETPLRFTFFHFLETMDDVIAGEPDMAETCTEVRYLPFTFDEYVGSRAAYDVLLDGYADCRETFAAIGFQPYLDIVEPLRFPDATDREALRASDFAASFEAAVVDAAPSDVDAAKAADQAIRELNRARKRTFFTEDLDAFEGFLSDRLDELNRRRAGAARFPVDGPAGEPNYRRVNHRDLLLRGGTDG